jgi:beta-lactam-binding protein with PASTA domain/tRNA A-37 threonylcarbamoyl transferase component Bud32
VDTSTGLPSGTVLEGRYRLGAMIARGGMSTVYRGVDTRLDRSVAIKVMSPHYVSDPAFLSRFEREARLAASLGHSGVVAVYDQGRDGDQVFLVMELVDGGTLRDLLREQGSLSVPVTISILEPLLAALAAAHSAGLVHRDVKPENVLISATGTVKIADFGLVRAVSSQTMATGDVILGTVAYLSPEQVATGAADARSDVYATGVMAYEMLTGQPPFHGDNPMSVAYQHVHSDVPRPSGNAPGTPQALDELIVAATRRDPALRPRDASAFLSALVGIGNQLGLRRVPVPVPRRHPVVPPAPVGQHVEVIAAPAGLAPGGGGPVAQGPGGTQMFAAGPVSTGSAPAAVLPQPSPGTGPTETAEPAPRSPTVALRQRTRRRWLIAILVVVLLGLAAAAGGWWLGGRWAATPAAVGLTQADAEILVRDAGLIPRFTSEHHNDVPAGQVASSDPAAGTEQLRGSEVDLLVSMGRPQVPKIPSGSDPAAATAALTAADLTVVIGPEPAFDDSVAKGAVLRTDPVAGTSLPVNAPVTLVISAGPAPVAVPELTGKSAEDAENKLVVEGFVVGPRTVTFDPDRPRGTVIGTTPAAGAEVPRGSEVSLTVADALAVPDVVGQSAKDATTELEKAGFTVTVGNPAFDADVDAGDILRTDPAAGAKVDPNDPRVFLVPSNAVSVPDLTDDTVEQARQKLEKLGLQLSVSALFGGEDATVFDQFPGRGGRVEPGGTVSVTAFP